MALTKKILTAYDIYKKKGLTEIGRLISNKFMLSMASDNLTGPTREVSGMNNVMFRFATCNDLIRLMAKYPEYCFLGWDSSHSRQWGLKQMGTLFCAEKIHEMNPGKILEVGAGFNTFFDTHFAGNCEYWMLDDTVGFCDEEKFNVAVKERRNTHFVRSLLGKFSAELPENYFDLVFSISALEHVPLDKRDAVYSDMFRIVRPGGVIVHSIDMFRDKYWSEEEYGLIKKAGFLVPSSPDLNIRVWHGEGAATLFEPVEIVFKAYYGGDRKDMWSNLRDVDSHVPTILVVAKKSAVDD